MVPQLVAKATAYSAFATTCNRRDILQYGTWGTTAITIEGGGGNSILPRVYYNNGEGERVSYLQYTALKLKMQSHMTICAYMQFKISRACLHVLYWAHVI